MTRDEFIAAARSCLGTKFHHQGRMPGAGLDCIGLVVCSLRKCGYAVDDDTTYSRMPSNGHLMKAVRSRFEEVPNIGEGSIIVLAFRDNVPQHVAITTGQTMIHTYQYVHKVVEHDLDKAWRDRIVGVFEPQWQR